MSEKHYLEAELEEKIRDDPAVWEFIRRSSLDGVWYWDLEKPEHEWMSPEFWETLGYDPSTKEHLANAWQDIIFPDDLQVASDNALKHMKDPTHPYDQVVRYKNAGGFTTWIRCRGLAIRDENGKAVRLLGAHTDLTETIAAAQKQQEAVEVANNRLNAVLNAAQSGIVGLDANGQISFVNHRARHLLGGISTQPPFDWPGEIEFVGAEDLGVVGAGKTPVERALAGEKLSGELAIMTRKSSDVPRYVRVASATVDQSATSDVVTVLVLDDVSEMERNRQQVERSSRLDALGQLTGGIAHDFNNLLAVIKYSVHLAAEDPKSPKAEAYLEKAMSSVQRGTDLTKRLLAFAKRQPGLAASIFVPDVLKEFAAFLEPVIEEHIEVVFENESQDLWVFCDHAQLENALLNLVLNSRDSIARSETGSKIVVKVRGVAEIGASIAVRSEDHHTYIANGLHVDHDAARRTKGSVAHRYVEFAITDNGPGMSEEVQRRALDPFFSTKGESSGTGLGLSMVYGFIQQSKGEMRVYSEVGHGTTVRLLLPRGTPEGVREEPVQRLVSPTGNGQHIHIVEDEENLLEMITDLVISLGYAVSSSRSGVEAIEKIKAGQEFDLLLTDIVMPGGVTGFNLAQQTREIRPDVPVLYMSGYTGFSNSEMGPVVAPLIQKPSPPMELATALKTALSG